MTSAAADDLTPAGALSRNLHRIVVVGGGAGGLELVTRLGDTLGRRCRADIALIEKARTHLWKPLLHEVAAGSMDVSRHELDYLAQAYWHGFRYKFGEMIGLDRARHLVHLAANLDDEGRLITPERSVGYDTLVIAIGSVSNDFGTPGVKEYAICLDTPDQAQRFQSPSRQRLPAGPYAGGAGPTGPTSRCDYRRRSDRHGAIGRTAPHCARCCGLWAR